MVLKQVAGRLLENDEGQGEDESDVQAWTQHTGVLHIDKITYCDITFDLQVKGILCDCLFFFFDLQPRWSRFCRHLHLK